MCCNVLNSDEAKFMKIFEVFPLLCSVLLQLLLKPALSRGFPTLSFLNIGRFAVMFASTHKLVPYKKSAFRSRANEKGVSGARKPYEEHCSDPQSARGSGHGSSQKKAKHQLFVSMGFSAALNISNLSSVVVLNLQKSNGKQKASVR
jgi:hypothetical protein